MCENKNEVISSFITGASERIDDIEAKFNEIVKEFVEISSRIYIGSDIQGYVVTALTHEYCLAERSYKLGVCDFVVWNIDNDKKGVNSGRYFNSRESAVSRFGSLMIERFKNE